jgi:hypothetical protein
MSKRYPYTEGELRLKLSNMDLTTSEIDKLIQRCKQQFAASGYGVVITIDSQANKFALEVLRKPENENKRPAPYPVIVACPCDTKGKHCHCVAYPLPHVHEES